MAAADWAARATAGSPGAPSPTWQVIAPSHGRLPLQLGELWRYRDLLYFLTRREISIRYRQTALGALWAVLQPLLTMVVFTLFLGRLARVPSDGIPYPVFSYLGLLPWTLFSSAVTRSGASLVGNANLLSKVYFPRLLIPLAATLSALVDHAIAVAVLFGLMAWYHLAPRPGALWLLPLTLLAVLASLGTGLWLAALNVQYRDVQHAVPFLMQLWTFASPVAYPASLVPARFRLVYQLNPMAGVVEAFRAAPLGRPLGWTALAVGTAVSLVLLAAGLHRFKATERVFADVV